MSVSKPELSELDFEVLQGLAPALQPKLLEALQQSSRRVASLEEQLRSAELENRYLRELLRRERLAKYGPGSEKLSDAQLALLELDMTSSGRSVTYVYCLRRQSAIGRYPVRFPFISFLRLPARAARFPMPVRREATPNPTVFHSH